MLIRNCLFPFAICHLLLLLALPAFTADMYWTGKAEAPDQHKWNNAANWSTTSDGKTPAPGFPGANDDVYFNSTAANELTSLGADVSVRKIIIPSRSTGDIVFPISNSRLTLGAGGIDLDAKAGRVSLGCRVELSADQIWTNNSLVNLLQVDNYVRADRALTIKGVGTVCLAPFALTQAVTIHIAGAVVHSGVYTLAPGARINDALKAAGGATEEGYPDALNLAAHLQDGQKITVPTRTEWAKISASNPPPQVENQQNELPTTTGTVTTVDTKPTTSAKVTGEEKINVNTATLEELQRLPRVGPVMAQAIIDFRTKNGPFTDYAQLLNIPRIGEKTLEELKPHITL